MSCLEDTVPRLKHESLNGINLSLPLRKFPSHDDDFAGTATKCSVLVQGNHFLSAAAAEEGRGYIPLYVPHNHVGRPLRGSLPVNRAIGRSARQDGGVLIQE